MKHLDVKSLLIGAAAGALLLSLAVNFFDTSNNNRSNIGFYVIMGMFVGAGVQLIERFSGAS